MSIKGEICLNMLMQMIWYIINSKLYSVDGILEHLIIITMISWKACTIDICYCRLSVFVMYKCTQLRFFRQIVAEPFACGYHTCVFVLHLAKSKRIHSYSSYRDRPSNYCSCFMPNILGVLWSFFTFINLCCCVALLGKTKPMFLFVISLYNVISPFVPTYMVRAYDNIVDAFEYP